MGDNEQNHWRNILSTGIIISAIGTAVVGLFLIKRLVGKPSLEGEVINIPVKKPGKVNYPVGGFLFGLGWGTIGLCPGPIFALVGTGSLSAIVLLASALHGTWLFGVFRDRLPK